MKLILYYVFIIAICFSGCRNNQSDHNIKLASSPTSIKTDSSQVNDVNNRDVWQNPDYVVSLLGNVSDQTVADIGAGSGYFSFRILPKAKKLIAVDIDKKFINIMNEKASALPEDQRIKFEARLAKPEDPELKENEVETALVVNTYIYIKDRIQYFKNLKKALSPKGKLVIVDFKDKDIPVGPNKLIKLSSNQVTEELRRAGYKYISSDTNKLEYQYIIIADNNK